MKIDAMVLREDFYNILVKTLENYYRDVFGKAIIINVTSRTYGSKILIYPKINAITTRFPNKKVIDYSYDEFNVRGPFWKFIAAKIYVSLCMFTGGLLASKALTYSDYSVFNSTILISPANRKIRVYDFAKGIVDAIVKNTFTSKYFENELSFRLNSKYDFVLPIIEHGETWYREEILPGQPLARIKDQKLYDKCIHDAVSHVKALAEDTIEYVNAADYAQKLYSEISEKLIIAREQKNITHQGIIEEIACIALRKAAQLNAPLPIVESHGDLQSGNVWVDRVAAKVYIIDWETHGKRSIWYDCATILLSTRRANQLKMMVMHCETDIVKNAVLINDNNKNYDMQAVMGIIILEDIMFYLDDMLELPLNFGAEIFERITMEMDRIGWRQ